jgi:hypothetical protein
MAENRYVGDVVVRVDRPQFVAVYLILARPGWSTCQLRRSDGSVARDRDRDRRCVG